VQQVVSRYHLRYAAATTAVSVTDLTPYYPDQMFGLIGGMRGAAEYEQLIDYKGTGTAGLNVLTFGQLLVIAAIVLATSSSSRAPSRGETLMQIPLSDLLGHWVAIFLTIAILSYLYADNPFYKLAEHIFVGTSIGYVVVVAYFEQFKPNLIDRLTSPGLGSRASSTSSRSCSWRFCS